MIDYCYDRIGTHSDLHVDFAILLDGFHQYAIFHLPFTAPTRDCRTATSHIIFHAPSHAVPALRKLSASGNSYPGLG